MSHDAHVETSYTSELTDTMEKALLAGNCSFVTSVSMADAIMKELEDKNKLTESLQQTIRAHRNTFAPFNRLPNEIVNYIFRYCAPSPAKTDLTTKRQLAFSQVCRTWRNFILNDPFIWNTPIFEAPLVAEMMLSRARDVPLHIYLGPKCSTVAETTELGFADHARLQSIEIRCYRHQQAQDLFSVGAGPMPLLETLCLDIQLPGAFDWKDFEAPRLRTLRLRHCMPPELSSMTSYLVELYVTSFKRIQFDPMALRQVLRNCTSLRRLGLCCAVRHVLASSTPAPVAGNEVLDLPNLEHILIEDRIDTTSNVLSSLRAPKLSRVSVYSGSEYVLHDVEPLLDLCTSIRILLDAKSPLELALLTYTGLDKQFIPLNNQAFGVFSLEISLHRSNMDLLLAVLPEVLPLDRVKKLRFGCGDTSPDILPYSWQKLDFKSFRPLTTITVVDPRIVEKINKQKQTRRSSS